MVARAEGLTQYAWRFRYPGDPYEPDAAEAEREMQNAETVVTQIESRLTTHLPARG